MSYVKRPWQNLRYLMAMIAILAYMCAGPIRLYAEANATVRTHTTNPTSNVQAIEVDDKQRLDTDTQRHYRRGQNIAIAIGLTVITVAIVIVAAQKNGANVPFATW